MKFRTLLGVGLALCGPVALLSAQSPQIVGAQFDVVSIKPHSYDPNAGAGMRRLPDGGYMMTSMPFSSILLMSAPEPMREVSGAPRWVETERYDFIAKPPPGSHPTREEQAQMMRNMFIDRMKLAGHIEQAERTTFALVVARSDGRLGPQLKKSTLDCASQATPTATTPPDSDIRSCGPRFGPGIIEAGGIKLDQLVLSLTGQAGGFVTNRTGLDGYYALTLHYAPPGLRADGSAPSDDAPQFVTALQEQLGLKLVPEKTKVKIFVIDHIERPTPND